MSGVGRRDGWCRQEGWVGEGCREKGYKEVESFEILFKSLMNHEMLILGH
jgi:hypothetical protein